MENIHTDVKVQRAQMSCVSEFFVFSLLSLLPSSGLFNIAVGGKKFSK